MIQVCILLVTQQDGHMYRDLHIAIHIVTLGYRDTPI